MLAGQVYAFGIVLWEVFAQQVPFSSYEIEDIRRAVTSGDRPRVPTIDTPEEVSEAHHEPSWQPPILFWLHPHPVVATSPLRAYGRQDVTTCYDYLSLQLP